MTATFCFYAAARPRSITKHAHRKEIAGGTRLHANRLPKAWLMGKFPNRSALLQKRLDTCGEL
ncbi:hypothetical protein AMJ85_05205 [candidate division BRC1 bacterium SM23_51]|nr:MAG: hypothetical protein AMJ85_05205 [candidate division BRC1 bacterium SM23_51]